ncbi:hypothetical protein OnM2_066055 [Erysiphe neolycopersici]|uniref:Uncharacterized protein n=1 Tax=Erysiphe neolycopersici TaxID=212602 RepID=A0A420HMD6_9PEZI|nr:hypothetical protein OnM2_066055 [Erysiphe neolycopersici]
MATILEDPRLRHRWNQISQNAELATETAAANIWTFQHKYINPCFDSVVFGIEKCIGTCYPNRDERVWRRSRGRAEASFDFYDDWDQDDNSRNRGLLGNWGNDELGRLLASNRSHSNRVDSMNQQPRRKRTMSYGTRGRCKSLENDPTVIPSTSALGFLGRLPFKLGGTLRYKPSAADLQEHPGKFSASLRNKKEGESSNVDEGYKYKQDKRKGHKRNRGSTMSSDQTSNSFRSRRDLLPSDEEEDAVSLGDEFALDVERRNIGFGIEEDTRQARSERCGHSSRNSSIIISPIPQSTSRSKLLLDGKQDVLTGSQSETTDILSPVMVQTSSTFVLQEEEARVAFEKETEEKKQKARSL